MIILNITPTGNQIRGLTTPLITTHEPTAQTPGACVALAAPEVL